MGINEAYANEEEMIISNDMLTEEEKREALRDLYYEGYQYLEEMEGK